MVCQYKSQFPIYPSKPIQIPLKISVGMLAGELCAQLKQTLIFISDQDFILPLFVLQRPNAASHSQLLFDGG